GGPAGQPRRHRDLLGGPPGGALGDDQGARDEVADPAPVPVDQRGDQRDHTGADPDLHRAGQRPAERLAEPDRRAVGAHHAQPQRELAHRAAPGERLDRGRVADEDQHHQPDLHGHGDRAVQPALYRIDQDQRAEQRGELQQHVDQQRHRAGGESGRAQVEHHGVPGDQLGRPVVGVMAVDHRRPLVSSVERRPSPRNSRSSAGSGAQPGHRRRRGRGAEPVGSLIVEIDVFAAAHRSDWERLEVLVRRRRRLTGAEADELVDLYQRVSTHLSVVRSSGADPVLVGRLSGLVARARAAVVGASDPAWRDVARFFTEVFPAVLYRLRWWWILTSLGTVAFSAALGAWVALDPEVMGALGTPESIRAYVEHDFANYYVENPGASFAAQVWTNNAWAAAQALIFGVFGCLPTIYVLVLNGANLGVAGGMMVAHGKGDVFFGLIIPHGLLELTAVFVAAG